MGLTTSREVPPTDEVISIVSPSPSVISHWNNKQPNHHFRQASIRSRAPQPIPDQNELDKRFAKVLVSTATSKCCDSLVRMTSSSTYLRKVNIFLLVRG